MYGYIYSHYTGLLSFWHILKMSFKSLGQLYTEKVTTFIYCFSFLYSVLPGIKDTVHPVSRP